MTQINSLPEIVAAQLDAAHESTAARSAVTLHGGRDRVLRQTVIALVGGQALGEHDSPGEATLQVLAGRVRLRAGETQWELDPGDWVAIPPVRHDLEAIEDAAVLLTVVVRSDR